MTKIDTFSSNPLKQPVKVEMCCADSHTWASGLSWVFDQLQSYALSDVIKDSRERVIDDITWIAWCKTFYGPGESVIQPTVSKLWRNIHMSAK